MPTENLSYRAAQPDDIPQLKQLALLSYGTYAPLLSRENLAVLRSKVSDEAMWSELLRISFSFLCCEGEQIVGMAFLVPHGNPWDVYPAEWSYIRMVGVDTAYTRQGIARRLTQMCIDQAVISGEHTIALHTSEIMTAAQDLYLSLGFKAVREIGARFGVRYHLYTKQLNE